MSGHSKWANIRVKKTAQDVRRGKVFTRHARLIEIAARSGGGDPGMNATLRTAIGNAKADGVPNANIERAIKKGTGELKGAGQMEEVTYEAYGPGGAAFIIECLTDNRNRTIANIRSIIERSGGHLAASNAVMWMFERKGLVVAQEGEERQKGQKGQEGQKGRDAPPTVISPSDTTGRLDNPAGRLEKLELELIDFGAEDIVADGDIIRVTTNLTEWPKIRDFLKTNGFEVLSAGLSYIPKQKAPITDEAMATKVAEFIEAVEEVEDVAEVHTNAELST